MKMGNCFETAGQYQLGAFLAEKQMVTLVHGLVVATKGPLEGKSFAHAWIECEENGVETVIDVELKQQVPRDVYYRHGQVGYTKKYSLKEAAKACVEHGHYGAWDEHIIEVDAEHDHLRTGSDG